MSNAMNTTETNELKRVVSITLAGETREVTIERYTAAHCWHALSAVVCKFRTGNKLHTSHRPQVFEKSKQRGGYFGSDDYFFGTEVVHNRHAKVVAWADAGIGNSGWTYNK